MNANQPRCQVNISKVRTLLEEMARLFTRAGVPVKPYLAPELPVFSKRSVDDQAMLARELEDRVELFAQAAREGISLDDTRQMLWRSLRKAGWTPLSDVFDNIEQEDTVEVYSLEMKQIFRNLEFFRHISYTLEEVHGGAWHELSARDKTCEAELMKVAMAIATGQVKTTSSCRHIPAHECRETQSCDLRRFMIEMKVLSPVFRDGEMVAIIAVNRTRAL